MAAGCRYDSAGPWAGGANCSGRFYPGTEALGEALKDKWGGSYGGYSCRPNTADTSQLSVHGTGRALDWFQPSKAAGDAAAAWLVENHEKFGIQQVIWYRRDWRCGEGWTSYGGPNPHTDHIHTELTIPASRDNTAATYQAGGLSVSDVQALIEVTQRQGELTREKIEASTAKIITAVQNQGKLTREKIAATHS